MKEEKIKDIYRLWNEAFSKTDIKPLSDDFCCRLLAVIYVFAGNSETFTYNNKLLADVEYAEKKLNIGGGLIPDITLFPIMKSYISELEIILANSEYKNSSDFVFAKEIDSWAIKFMYENYKIKIL